MTRPKNFKSLKRALGIMSAAIIVVGGVTFAALQSQQDTLTGNTIETSTANLLLSTDGASYSDSQAGFDFNNLLPGGPAMPANGGYPVYLKNTGSIMLAPKLSVSSVPSNPAHVDLSKVNILLTDIDHGTTPQSFSLQSLMAGSAGGVAITGPNLPAGNSREYKLQVSMDSDAISGTGAALGNIDLAFSGLAQAN